jgi:type II secretory pathway component PulM
MRSPTIRRTRFSARPPRGRHSRAARERRGLAGRGASCGLEVLFQLLVLAPQPLSLRFRSSEILVQPLVLTTQFLDDLLRCPIRRLAIRHAGVMPESRSKYKYGILDLSSHPLN